MRKKEKRTKTSRERALESMKRSGLKIELPEEDIKNDVSFKESLRKVSKEDKNPDGQK